MVTCVPLCTSVRGSQHRRLTASAEPWLWLGVLASSLSQPPWLAAASQPLPFVVVSSLTHWILTRAFCPAILLSHAEHINDAVFEVVAASMGMAVGALTPGRASGSSSPAGMAPGLCGLAAGQHGRHGPTSCCVWRAALMS